MHSEKLSGQEFRRRQQQGLGKPIIHADFKGKKIVAINNRVLAGDWKTFHDFLLDFFRVTIKQSWGERVFSLEPKDTHPIILFYKKLTKKLNKRQKSSIKSFKDSTQIHSEDSNGEIQCFLNFAYSLYEISHNNELSKKFLKRLKNHDQFWGAYYEAYVACILLRAGFSIEFEDESDSSSTHGELIAIDPATGVKYWVEAKFKISKELQGKSGDDRGNFKQAKTKIYKALRKDTSLDRIIFIELCTPNLPSINGNPWWYSELESTMREFELEDVDWKPAPEAFFVFTSQDLFCNLSSSKFNTFIYVDGFKKSDYGHKAQFKNIDEALHARKKYNYMDRIIDTFRDFQIPATFDGEIPEFAFNSSLNKNRLLIGKEFLIPGNNGKEIVGVLKQAMVLPGNTNSCTCMFDTEEGSSIVKIPLSDEEIRAYKSYPDTFFGKYEKADKTANSPLEFYDFIYNSYKDTPKETLLELMHGSNEPTLKDKSQKELAELYAKGITSSSLPRLFNQAKF
jgi:hypothetical protein